jgi:hypothetical protein
MGRFKNIPFQRVNRIEFIKTEQIGAMDWVSYNTGEFKVNNEARTVKWLESAVLVKEKGTGRLGCSIQLK